MSSTRGGYRRGAHHGRHQTDECSAARPIPDQAFLIHEASSSLASTPAGFSSFHPKERIRPQHRWNSRRRGGKSRYVNKSDKGREGSGGASNTSLSLDSDCDNLRKGEISAGELGFGLNRDPNDAEIEGDGDDGGKGKGKGKKIEEVKASDEIDEDEAIRRLEGLGLSAELGLELSEEMVTVNRQLQEDELLALESIYGDNVFILDNQSGLKCFQVHIHVEAPKGLHITAKFNSSNIHEKRDRDSSDSLYSYSFQVEYLPPIILTCLLPEPYPSKCAPLFTIYSQWLEADKISQLCSKLDLIWKDQAGQEVIYQWVEFLRTSTLSYLGFDNEIVLGTHGIKNTDRRAISGSVSPDIDIPAIKSYNDEQRHENFCRNIQQCCICFNEYPGSEFIRLPCQHFFCEPCIKTFSNMHIKEATVLKLKCPEAKCEGVIPPGFLKRLLRDEEFEHWESLMLQKTLESMNDVVYCPRCETACLEDGDNHAQCSKCFYSFCSLCRERRHVGFTCITPELKLAILQGRQNSNKMKDEQRRREQDMINQLLSVKEINRSAKQCPSCKMAISRTEGCNKMVCDNCGQYFCYRCNKAISGYEHFRDGACELFPAEEIQRWEARMNAQHIVGQIQADLFPEHSQPCPNCGQPNVKVGNNNHIFCWSCQKHYCYLCKKMVRRGSQHYGPKGCKQHTAD